jgi:chemotaxis protein CheC
MEIGELELDALCELANVGLSRAATRLSELLQDNIEMTTPSVRVVGYEALQQALQLDEKSTVAAVWQQLTGNVEGTSMLMFPTEDSRMLVQSLVGSSMQNTGEADLRAIEHEAMMEIGNIIISSATAVMADMLGQDIRMSMPHYAESTLSDLMAQRDGEQNMQEMQEMQVIIMNTRLKAMQREIEGRMVMLMSVTSVQVLFARLRELLGISIADSP